ncbi:MAG: MraZ protein [Chitinophagales bacterium]
MARGSNHISLDAKGRMSIPTKLRDVLSGESGGDVVVTISPSDHCLLLYALEDWAVVEEKLTSLPTLNAQVRQLKRMLIGHADDCSMDGSGRILLPQQLREFANIDRKAVLVGQGDKYEIWDEAHWLAQRESLLAVELDESALPVELESLSF